MSPHIPSIFSHTKRWFSRNRSPHVAVRPDDNRQEHANASFFTNAQDVTINGGQLKLTQTNHYVNNTISSGNAVFELLKPYTCLDATKDSSARHPPPKCHPGTREKIRDKLMRWLVDESDPWKMLWIRGFAGTGKSAVAQSFADSCDEAGILGGAYFFFRAAGLSKPDTVVPTLVYQLAINVPDYQSFIEHRLAKNPLLLENSSPVQFRKLIVEPFAILQRERPRKPIVVILDGFDECEGEHAQREILNMITDTIRTNPDLPLRWLIFSRPEAHLKNAFSSNLDCGRDELCIDAECRDNVEKYVKDELLEIKAAYKDITPVDWPAEADLQELIDAVGGLFVLASTCINYISDSEAADPAFQLNALLKFMRRLEVILSSNPLETLDLLYLRILEDIPPTVFETTWRILACLSLQAQSQFELPTAQAISNFLRLDRHTFYKAVRGLHSIMWVPDPEDAPRSQLQFHHTSFQDFLLDPNRSGKFAIVQHKALVDILLSSVYWCDIDVMHFHTNDRLEFDFDHKHDALPGLPWASDDNRVSLSKSILDFVQQGLFTIIFDFDLDSMDGELLSQASKVDFRYWYPPNIFQFSRICLLDPSTGIVHTEPSSPTDYRLLEYFNLAKNGGASKPVVFPLSRFPSERGCFREYFFIGHGDQSMIVWRTISTNGSFTSSLRCDKEPSTAWISQYERKLKNID